MTELDAGAHSTPSVVAAPEALKHRGEWLATVRFRSLDGDERIHVLQAFGDTADDARVAVISRLDDARGADIQTITGDGPAARDYVEAAGHMHELRSALKALDLADAADDDDLVRLLRAQR